jgi:uncharacterized protein (TIGR02757 family)
VSRAVPLERVVLKTVGLEAWGNRNRFPHQPDTIMNKSKVHQILNDHYHRYHHPAYLVMDPLKFVREYTTSTDREVVGLLASSLAYGKVEIILNNITRVLKIVGKRPAEYIWTTSFTEKKHALKNFKHRFNHGADIAILFESMKMALREYGSLESLFGVDLSPDDESIRTALSGFVRRMRRYAKKIAPQNLNAFLFLLPSPDNGSTCKRLNMFLRWMVRRDDGIDLGVWNRVKTSKLVMPVDTHVAAIGRKLRLSGRKSVDWQFAEEITTELKKLDPDDPVKYDFSICRAGMIDARLKK